MSWEEYDKSILTPYEKTGSPAKMFSPNLKVFSYTALRHVAYYAFKSGAASNKGNQPDAKRCAVCGGTGKMPNVHDVDEFYKE